MRQIIVDFGRVGVGGLEAYIRIYGYGLMLVLGFLSGIYLARWRARRMGENPDVITYAGLMALIGGVVGSRGAYIIQNWDQFVREPSPLAAMLNISSGGLIYYGGLVLGLGMVVAYLLIKRLPARRILDIITPSLMIGLAFGRMGCLLNGCCFGAACSESWAFATHFPMYSKPLVKVDRSPGPFSAGTDSPSPVYSHQLDNEGRGTRLATSRSGHRVLETDPRLLVQVSRESAMRGRPVPPRYLHGKLNTDQLAIMTKLPDIGHLGESSPGQRDARKLFDQAAPGGTMNEAQFEAAREKGNGILRGSECWAEALTYATGQDSKGYRALIFADLVAYFQARSTHLGLIFNLDDEQGRDQANAYLQQDLYALVSAEHSLAVKPAQAIGTINALLLAVLLLVFHRQRSREGQVFALMLVLYPITRILEESIRGDNNHIGVLFGMTHNQVTSVAMVVLGIVMLLALRWLPASSGPAWRQRLEASKSR